jgi:hypothetical protein
MKPEKEKYDLVYQVVGYAMEVINHQSLDNEVADV